jgi:hypothetical protein
MGIPIIEAKSWQHLHGLLFHDGYDKEIQRYRLHHAFRGVGDSTYSLNTSLMRLGGDYQGLERHLLRNFKKYAHQNVVEKDSIWHWLSVAQHYGLPTRLLDWTYSPNIALHFATAETSLIEKDGAVWKVDLQGVHKLLPNKPRAVMDKEKSKVFTVEMLSGCLQSLDELDGIASSGMNYALFFEPPSIDARIINQFAYFSVLSNNSVSMDTWLNQHSDLCTKIIIPSSLKWECRDKLDQNNISERVLFPGLDGLCSWLTRHYSTRTKGK